MSIFEYINGSRQVLPVIFYPIIALINRLGYVWKFVLLVLISLAEIVMVAYSVYTHLDNEIRTSQRELAGIELIHPIVKAIQLFQRHRDLSAEILCGDPTMQFKRTAKAREADEVLDDIVGKLSPGLVSSASFRQIRRDWARIQNEGLNWAKNDNFVAHTRLIEQMRLFEITTADDYALTTFPEIETSYLIDTTVSILPRALENIAQIRGYATGILAENKISEPQKVVINTMIAELAATLRDIKINLDKSSSNNPILRASFTATTHAISDTARQIGAAVATVSIVGHSRIRPIDSFSLSTQSIDKSYAQMYQLYEVLLPATEALIETHLDKSRIELRTSIGIASLLILVWAYFSIGICYVMIFNIRSLNRSALAFVGGDMSSRITMKTRDELGSIGNNFNELADRFNALLKARHADEARLRATIENAMSAVVHMDAEGKIIGWNGQAENIFGWLREEAVGRVMSETIVPLQYRESHVTELKRYLLTGEGHIINSRIEITALHRDGHEFPVGMIISPITIGDKHEFCAFIRDISEAKAAASALAESELRYKHMIDVITDYQYTVRVENGHAVNATHSPGCLAVTGYSAEEFTDDHNLWLQIIAPEERDRVLDHNRKILTEADMPPIEFRFVRKNGEPCWVSQTTIPLKDASGSLLSYDGVIKDITERKNAEAEILEYAAKLESAFMRTVEVTTTLFEIRDPYTAGHERRVSELASAIGIELGLNGKQVEGIRVCGQLHDVGKICIPTEILAKPGSISTAEFTLIKDHPKSGYDILKDVDFPWPVAEVAWQHHERMDGSGYPRGLKGDEILLEARIITVADVVEAMASHRPYRQGFGIDVALEEIKHNRGVWYDAEVADACIKLFRELGYQLLI